MAVGPRWNGVTSIKDRLRSGRFGVQDRPVRNLAVPFDQRRNCAAASDDGLEQLPDWPGNGTVVAINEQRVAFIVGLFGMTGEVNLADARKREFRQILQGGEAVIGGRHEDIVDVE